MSLPALPGTKKRAIVKMACTPPGPEENRGALAQPQEVPLGCNLGKALPIYTECRRTQSLSNLTVAALTAQPLAALPPPRMRRAPLRVVSALYKAIQP